MRINRHDVVVTYFKPKATTDILEIETLCFESAVR